LKGGVPTGAHVEDHTSRSDGGCNQGDQPVDADQDVEQARQKTPKAGKEADAVVAAVFQTVGFRVAEEPVLYVEAFHALASLKQGVRVQSGG
jgi:hypothetical protein